MIEDIEDLEEKCSHDCKLAHEAAVAPGTPAARLQRLAHHIVEKRAKCAACPRPHPAAATGARAEEVSAERAALTTNWHHRWHLRAKEEGLPIVDPYGSMMELSLLKTLRDEERIPRDQYFEQLKQGKLPAPADSLAYIFQGKGKWPYRNEYYGQEVRPNPYMLTPQLDALLRPIVKEFIGYLKEKTTCMPYEPMVVNGYATYADPKRFQAECKHLFREGVLLAGFSSDVAKPHDYKRWEAMGKSVLLTRDADGKFHAFANVCRHRGMELVGKDQPKGNRKAIVCPYHSWSYESNGKLLNVPFEKGFDNCEAVDCENRNLIELPADERAGLLLVILELPEGADPAKLFDDAMPVELVQELDKYSLGQHVCIAQQTLRIDANWKLGVDTFGEPYHFSTVHPFLREVFCPNTCVFRSFGEVPQHGCMTLGRFTMKVMAEGTIDESQWAMPTLMDHVLQVYHLAPNTVLNVGSSTILVSQHWPGSRAGEHYALISTYLPRAPVSDEDLEIVKRAFDSGLDVVATEDFPLLPRMQANFEQFPETECVFGRNEPCLIDRHRYFSSAVAGKY